MATTYKAMTLEQFLELPEKKPALEFEYGRVIQKVSPKGKHSVSQSGFLDLFNFYARPSRLARAFPELRTTFAGHSYVPDVAVYLQERIPVDEQGYVANEFFEPPDIAVEIKSPEQSLASQIRRCQWYVENGVPLALLAHPEQQSIRRFVPGEEPQLLTGEDPIDMAPVLPGFGPTVAEVFESLKV
jgi:Uma2 family endonuclease